MAVTSNGRQLSFEATIDDTQFNRSIRSMKGEVKSYQDALSKSTDPKRIVEYNRKIEDLGAEIKRLTNAGKLGFDELGNSINKPIGLLEKLKYQAKQYADVVNTSSNPEIISKYNRKLQETEIQINRVKNSGKDGFDKLGNAVKGSTNYATRAFSVLRNIAYILPGIGIAGLLSFAVEPLFNFVKGLLKVKDSISSVVKIKQELASANVIGAQDAQEELTHLKTLYKVTQDSTIPLKKRNEAVNELQKAYPEYFKNLKDEIVLNGGAKEAYERLTVAILETAKARAAEGLIAKNSARALENDQKVADLEEKKLKNQLALNKAKREEDAANSVSNTGTSGAGLGNIPAADKVFRIAQEIKATQKEINNLKTDTNLLDEKNVKLSEAVIKNIKNGAKISTGSDTIKKNTEEKKALREREVLLKRIDAIIDESTRKELSKDEAEIQSVRDKFKIIQAEVVKFNANPKHKIKIDGSSLDKTRDSLISDLKYKQDTEKLKIEVAEQKKIFDAFEDYKLEHGIEKANEKYSKDLKGFETYTDFLKAKIAVNLASTMGEGTAAQKDRRDTLFGDLDGAYADQQKRLDDLIKGLTDYEEERKRLIVKYNAEVAALEASGHSELIPELTKKFQENLGKLDTANNEKLESFKRLYEGIEGLSKAAAEKIVKDAEVAAAKLHESGKLVGDEYNKVKGKIQQTKQAIADRLPKDLYKIAGELRDIAGIVSEIDQGFGDMIGTLSNVVGSVGSVFEIVKKLNESKENGEGSLLGSIAGGLGMAGAAVGAVTAAISFIEKIGEKRRRQEAEQAKYSQDLQLKQMEAVTKALDRQLDLIKDIYGTERIKKYGEALIDINNKQVEQQSAIESKLQLTGDKKLDDLIERVNSVELKQGDGFFFNVVKMAKELGQIQDLKGKSLEQLLKLMDEGKLDASTSAMVQNLQILQDQYQATVNAMKADVTGTSIQNIGDEIVDMFANATTATEDFGKSFEDIIKKSILNSLKTGVFKDKLQAFYDDLAEASESGGSLDKAEIASLQQAYNEIVGETTKKFEDLKKVTGVDFGTSTTTPKANENSLEGSIRASLTEETGTVLAAEVRGQRLATMELLGVGKSSLNIITSSLRVQEQIQINTKDTVKSIRDAIVVLKSIEKKSGSNDGSLAANGI